MTDVPLRLVLSPWALFTPSTETIVSMMLLSTSSGKDTSRSS